MFKYCTKSDHELTPLPSIKQTIVHPYLSIKVQTRRLVNQKRVTTNYNNAG